MDYFFPNPEIRELDNDGLLTLITSRLPAALDMVDGTGCTTDVHIDYAQDIIEQARDILVSRGVEVSAELRLKLKFLDWRTPAEKERARAMAEAESNARFAAVKDASARLVPFAAAFKQEAEAFLLPRRTRPAVRLDTVQPGLSVDVRVERSTGTKFLAAKQRFEELLGEPVKVSYFGWDAGVPLEKSTNLDYTFHLPHRSDGRFYALVRNLVCSSDSSSVIVRFESDTFGAWEMVTEPFATHKRNSAEWKAIQALFAGAPTVVA